MNIQKTIANIENTKTRSAWAQGVKAYALELLCTLEDFQEEEIIDISNLNLLKKILLNGAQDWQQYSEGGCSLIYNKDIAKRLCTKSELAKTDNGQNPPNPREDWIACQARALFQAWALIEDCAEF